MIVIAHPAKRRPLPTGLLARLSQGSNKVVSVHIAQENVIALVATTHDLIHRARILQSKFARHDTMFTTPTSSVKRKNGFF
jgi:hypothetical protein